MQMKLKGSGANIALLLASLLLCVLACETFFYFLNKTTAAYPVVFFKTEDPNLRLWCYDDHFSGTPDWYLRHEHPFETLDYAGNIDDDPSIDGLEPDQVPNAIEVRSNANGFRERSLSDLQKKGADAKVVLLVGDSFCFGQGVRSEDRFSNILETKLNAAPDKASGQKYMLLNHCKAGINIRKIARVMERSIEKYPQVQQVVYSFTLNDPVMTREVYAMQKYINDFLHLRQIHLSEHFRFINHLPSPTLYWLTGRMVQNQVSRETIDWYKQMYADNSGWRLTQKVLRDMHAFCAAKNIDFSLLVFPIYYRLADYPLEEVHLTLEQFAREKDIYHLDLLEIFAGKNELDYWVHPRDFHPNNRAHREVAEFLFATMAW